MERRCENGPRTVRSTIHTGDSAMGIGAMPVHGRVFDWEVPDGARRCYS